MGARAARATSQPEPRSDHDPTRRDEQEEEPDTVERLVDLGERSCHLDRGSGTVREREHAQMRAVHRDVLPVRSTVLRGHGEDVLVYRKLEPLPPGPDDLPVRPDDLDIATSLAELGQHRQMGGAVRSLVQPQRMTEELDGTRLEGVVDRRA